MISWVVVAELDGASPLRLCRLYHGSLFQSLVLRREPVIVI